MIFTAARLLIFRLGSTLLVRKGIWTTFLLLRGLIPVLPYRTIIGLVGTTAAGTSLARMTNSTVINNVLSGSLRHLPLTSQDTHLVGLLIRLLSIWGIVAKILWTFGWIFILIPFRASIVLYLLHLIGFGREITRFSKPLLGLLVDYVKLLKECIWDYAQDFIQFIDPSTVHSTVTWTFVLGLIWTVSSNIPSATYQKVIECLVFYIPDSWLPLITNSAVFLGGCYNTIVPYVPTVAKTVGLGFYNWILVPLSSSPILIWEMIKGKFGS